MLHLQKSDWLENERRLLCDTSGNYNEDPRSRQSLIIRIPELSEFSPKPSVYLVIYLLINIYLIFITRRNKDERYTILRPDADLLFTDRGQPGW